MRTSPPDTVQAQADSQSRRNRFLVDPRDPDSALTAPALMVMSVPTSAGPMPALVDNNGCIVPFYELLEIMTLIQPFYDRVRDSDLVAHNERVRQRFLEETHATAPEGRKERSGYVYVLRARPYYRIGVAAAVDPRLRHLAAIPPFELELVATIPAADMFGRESQLHNLFADKNRRGDWFELTDEDLACLRDLEAAEWRTAA